MNWKTIAIIFICLFALETFFFTWSYIYYEIEEEKTYTCYYEICNGYPYAEYVEKVCSCYDYDMMGDYVLEKEEYIR